MSRTAPSPAEAGETAARVLLVDDNLSLVDNLKEILTDAGYRVTGTHSCEAAMTEGALGFDVALVDMSLPDGLGTDLINRLRLLSPDAAMVLLTANSTIEAASAAVRAGAFAYLSKPCAASDLLLTVGQASRQVQLHGHKRAMAHRVRMTEKLAAVGTMTAGLSHEIRNPLNAAGLQLSVLERRIEKLPAEAQPGLLVPLKLVRDEIRRLDHLLEDFLQLAKPRHTGAGVVELSALAGRVLDLLEKDAARRGVVLKRALHRVPAVAGDDGQLRQVVMNLTLMRLEASSGGAVTLTTALVDELVQLTVDDTGAGVPPEIRDRIFEPFFTTKATGSGLGLPIVHAIVTQYGGTLTVEDAPTGGARFVVRLPQALRQ